MDEYIHDDNQSTLLTQNRSKSGSPCKSHHKNVHKLKGVNNSSGKKTKHRRERTVSNDDLKPNIFNTPISKSFSRNTQQIDENFMNVYQNSNNEGVIIKKKQKVSQRVPLGQLIMTQQP